MRPNVPTQSRKPFFIATLLLTCPWLGGGNRAEGCFALSQSAAGPHQSRTAFTSELQPALSADSAPAAGTSISSSARTGESPPERPTPEEHEDRVPTLWSLVTSQTGGASSSGAGPTGAGSGACQSGILPLDPQMPKDTLASSLCLAESRFKPPPFCSRLFRPPR
jgi:hypothetical protein